VLKTYENLYLDGCPVVGTVEITDYKDGAWGDIRVAYVPNTELLDHVSFVQYVSELLDQNGLVEAFCAQIFEELEEALRPIALRVVVFWAKDPGSIRAVKEFNWGMDADTLAVLREEMAQA